MDLQQYVEQRILEWTIAGFGNIPPQVVRDWMYDFNIGTQLIEDNEQQNS